MCCGLVWTETFVEESSSSIQTKSHRVLQCSLIYKVLDMLWLQASIESFPGFVVFGDAFRSLGSCHGI